MRARPREPQEGASTSVEPTKRQMWSLWAGECMADRCRKEAEVWITTQLTWRSAVAHWTYCGGHAWDATQFFVSGSFYFIQIEEAGVHQPTLPLD